MEEKELSDGLTKGVGAASSADEPRTRVIFQREMGRWREGEWTKRGPCLREAGVHALAL